MTGDPREVRGEQREDPEAGAAEAHPPHPPPDTHPLPSQVRAHGPSRPSYPF